MVYSISARAASRVACRAELLKHPFLLKVVDHFPFFGSNPSAHHREVLPQRGMRQKLLDQHIPRHPCLGKEQQARK